MRWSRLRAFLVIFAVFTASACTRSLQERTSHEEESAVTAGDTSCSNMENAYEDSLEMMRRMLGESRLPYPEDVSMEEPFSLSDAYGAPDGPERVATSPAQASPEAIPNGKHVEPRSGWISRAKDIMQYMRFTGLYGYQSDEKVQFINPKWLSAGFRSSERGDAGFVHIKPGGPLETLAIGNLRIAFGEGLLLGRRDPRKTPLCASRREGDFIISSSLSCWERTNAAGGRFRLGNLRLGTLVWERTEEPGAPLQGEAWLSVSYAGRGYWVGLVAGQSLRRTMRTAGSGTPMRALAVSMSVRQESAKTAVSPRRRTGFSGEAAVWDDETFYVFAVGLRGGGTGWIRVFKQPAAGGFGGSANGLSRIDRILHGGALRWTRPIGTARIELSLYDGSIAGPSQSSRYRRGNAYLGERRRRSHPHAWGASVTYIERCKKTFASDELEPEAKRSAWREGRLGLQWDLAAGSFLSHRLRAELRVLEPAGAESVMISSGGRLHFRWGEVAYRFTNYMLAPSVCGYVSRPGVGPFEHLSFVYGCGSDISLRAKLWICSWFEILAYYGRPWQKQGRLYVGLQYPR